MEETRGKNSLARLTGIAAAAVCCAAFMTGCGSTDESSKAALEAETSAQTTTAAAETTTAAAETVTTAAETAAETTAETTAAAAEESSIAEGSGEGFEESFTKKFRDIVLQRDFMFEQVRVADEYAFGETLWISPDNNFYHCYFDDQSDGTRLLRGALYVIGDSQYYYEFVTNNYYESERRQNYVEVEDERILARLFLPAGDVPDFSTGTDEEGRPVEYLNADKTEYFVFDEKTGYPVSYTGRGMTFDISFTEGCGEMVLPEPPDPETAQNPNTSGFVFF